MGGRHTEAELGDEAREAGRLPLGQIEDQARESGRVDDRVLERALQPTADEPCVERVVTVFDQDGTLREAQKGAPGIFELGCADQHRAVDVVALSGIRVDRCPAVDQRVEEGQRAVEREAFGPELEDEKGRVAGRLDVERDELRVHERRLLPQLRGVDGYLLPWDELGCPAGLQVNRLRAHRASARARRAQAISSPSTARSNSTAAR
jgi:hypothetical protein